MCARKKKVLRTKMKSLLIKSMNEEYSFLKINKNAPQLLIPHNEGLESFYVFISKHNLFHSIGLLHLAFWNADYRYTCHSKSLPNYIQFRGSRMRKYGKENHLERACLDIVQNALMFFKQTMQNLGSLIFE